MRFLRIEMIHITRNRITNYKQCFLTSEGILFSLDKCDLLFHSTEFGAILLRAGVKESGSKSILASTWFSNSTRLQSISIFVELWT